MCSSSRAVSCQKIASKSSKSLADCSRLVTRDRTRAKLVDVDDFSATFGVLHVQASDFLLNVTDASCRYYIEMEIRRRMRVRSIYKDLMLHSCTANCTEFPPSSSILRNYSFLSLHVIFSTTSGTEDVTARPLEHDFAPLESIPHQLHSC